MTDKQKAAAAWILLGLIALGAVTQALYNLATRGSEATWTDGVSTVFWTVSPLIFGLVGALIISRRPGNIIGLLLMLPALVFASPVETVLAQYSTAPADPSALLLLITWFGEWGWLLLVMPVLFILVLFPTGKPLTPRWRWLIYLGLVMSLAFILFATFASELGPVNGDYLWRVSNPIGFIPSDFFDQYLLGPWFVLLPLLTIGCAASLFVRFRRAGVVEREQIKWLFYAGLLFAAVYVPTFLPLPALDFLFNFLFVPALLAFPIAIGIAILRYRLFDIDIIIRKTLLYILLTAVLLSVYFGMVLVTQYAFVALTGDESPIAVVVSTLVIAALFNPLRRRLQAFIDRRFYRKSYNAAQTLEQFTQTVRDEVDLDQISRALISSIKETMQPQTAVLWLRSAENND
ncbi:MAG: hypothetical protein ACK2UW_22185 [Anaerolineales bacterium]